MVCVRRVGVNNLVSVSLLIAKITPNGVIFVVVIWRTLFFIFLLHAIKNNKNGTVKCYSQIFWFNQQKLTLNGVILTFVGAKQKPYFTKIFNCSNFIISYRFFIEKYFLHVFYFSFSYFWIIFREKRFFMI